MSTLEVSNLNDGTTTVATTFVTNGSAKAWAAFGMDDNVIDNSNNVSSLTDNGTGDATLSYTSSFNAAREMAFSGDCAGGSATTALLYCRVRDFNTMLTSSIRLNIGYVQDTGKALGDYEQCSAIIQGDLA